MKILLPVDGSDFTKRMLGFVASHPEMFGPDPEFLVMTVVTPVPPQVTHFVDHRMLEKAYFEEAEEVLKPVRAFATMHKWHWHEWFVCGHPAQAIAQAVEAHEPHLLVMGSHGRSALMRVVLGSVTSAVLAHTKVPVLIVR